jgi:hypothetical protein
MSEIEKQEMEEFVDEISIICPSPNIQTMF